MAYTSVEIKRYVYKIFSSGNGGFNISLYDNAKQVGLCIFQEDTASLPPAIQDPRGIYRLYFKRSSFSFLVDLLRNEKPVYLHFWNGSENNSHLSSDFEPVGEGEV